MSIYLGIPAYCLATTGFNMTAEEMDPDGFYPDYSDECIGITSLRKLVHSDGTSWYYVPQNVLDLEDAESEEPTDFVTTSTAIVGIEGDVFHYIESLEIDMIRYNTIGDRLVTVGNDQHTMVVALLNLHPENRVERKVTVGLSLNTGLRTITVEYEERLPNSLFGAQCKGVYEYLDAAKRLDQMKELNAAKVFLKNAKKFVDMRRQSCAPYFHNQLPPILKKVDRASLQKTLVPWLRNFGFTDDQISPFVDEGLMPYESTLHNTWMLSMKNSGSGWKTIASTVESESNGHLLAPPKTAEDFKIFTDEADATIDAMETLIANQLPLIKELTLVFNRPIDDLMFEE